ncbi:MAG: Nif3-like dinuclear metal center hexameric protein [bacterium]|jgi:dinuclear metal center YbgI/SA1388 family protein
MTIGEIINMLETVAPPSLQESWDNSGLLTGRSTTDCSGVLLALDVTDAVLSEAVSRGCNLVVAHHPMIFRGLKRIDEDEPTGRLTAFAIRHDLAVYAMHTNLDNIIGGVNGVLADRFGLTDRRVLQPMNGQLMKLVCMIPEGHLEAVSRAVFEAGAGRIGDYEDCGFTTSGIGTFTPMSGANPFIGAEGRPETVREHRFEVILPAWRQRPVLAAMRSAHPYEEVAFDLVKLENEWSGVGSGIIGRLPAPMTEAAFLEHVKAVTGLPVLRHSRLTGRPIQTLALCGGAGAFLIRRAVGVRADAYLTGDLKYHDFFEPDGRLLLADIGHYESEHSAVDLLYNILTKKNHTFAVLKSETDTNPVNYH